MEIKKKMSDALNRQINRELYSAYLYLSMASYFEANNLRGFAHWMMKQAHEEKGHAMKMYKYVFERGAKVTLQPIEAPVSAWKSPLHTFEEVLAHERKVTALLNDLSDLAHSENDRATEIFLHWFISEQVEEEASAAETVSKLKMIGENKGGLMILDKELGARQ